MRVDLHTHTTASDGMLSPAELLTHAREAGVSLLAITDHDTVAGYSQLDPSADPKIKLVTGTEISTSWNNIGIHIVGLNVDLQNSLLRSGLSRQRHARNMRAEIIAARLYKLGFPATLTAARKLAGEAPVGRMHFARHLVETAAVPDLKSAFRKYLGAGKPGDVKSEWADMTEVIGWIVQAGGTAVLAHPSKYKLTNLKLEALVADFSAAGGQALEVISGQQDKGLTTRLAKLAVRRGLLVSTGSDFHAPGQSWAALGKQPKLPASCTAVWEAW